MPIRWLSRSRIGTRHSGQRGANTENSAESTGPVHQTDQHKREAVEKLEACKASELFQLAKKAAGSLQKHYSRLLACGLLLATC